MTKIKFLLTLSEKLSVLPQNDIEDRLNFYSEMVEDRMEEGLSEDEAVAKLGNIDEIADRILKESTKFIKDENHTVTTKASFKPKKRLSALEITLLIIGFPLWMSMIIAVFSVILSLYVSLLSLIISLWASWVSIIVCALGCTVSGVCLSFCGNVPMGLVFLSTGLVLAGLAIFMYFGCKGATKGIIHLSVRAVLWTKKMFSKKEGA